MRKATTDGVVGVPLPASLGPRGQRSGRSCGFGRGGGSREEVCFIARLVFETGWSLVPVSEEEFPRLLGVRTVPKEMVESFLGSRA